MAEDKKVLVLKCTMFMDQKQFKDMYESVCVMHKNGLIILPPYLEYFTGPIECAEVKIVKADEAKHE